MKKAYSKPDILFEDFSLSTSIATGCEVKTNTPSLNACGYRHGAYTVFVSSVGACQEDNGGRVVADGSVNIGTENDGFCYHNPSSLNNLFNS